MSQDLREFYDPDTVDLMQWIEQNSGVREPFVSSKQLSLLLLLLMSTMGKTAVVIVVCVDVKLLRVLRLVVAVFAVDLDLQGGRRLLRLYAAASWCETLHWEDFDQPSPL